MSRIVISLLLLYCTVGIYAQEKRDGWHVFTTKNSGLPNDNVRDIQMDKKGTFWIGTWGGGVTKFDQETWQTFNPSNSTLPGGIVNSICIKDGIIWATCHDQGIAKFDGELWTAIPFPSGVITQSITVNKSGIALIGTEAHGLFQYSLEGLVSRVWGEDNNIEYGVTDVDLDSKEFAIVSTRQGLFSFFKDPSGVYAAVKTVLKTEPTYKTTFDKKGRLWAIDAENFHVTVKEKGRWKKFRQTAPGVYVSLNGGTENYSANAIGLLSKDRIAFGTFYYGGIAVYNQKAWGPIFTPYSGRGLDGGIQAMIEDKDKALWVGTVKHGLMVQVGEDHKAPKLTEEEEKLSEEEKTALLKKRKRQYNMLTKRRVDVMDTIRCKNRRVEVLIWDAQKIDGDVISLALNGEFILENYTLAKRPKRIWIDLTRKKNKLVLYAHNLGDIPPNTASISILDVNLQKEISLSSDMKGSQSIIIIPE